MLFKYTHVMRCCEIQACFGSFFAASVDVNVLTVKTQRALNETLNHHMSDLHTKQPLCSEENQTV